MTKFIDFLVKEYNCYQKGLLEQKESKPKEQSVTAVANGILSKPHDTPILPKPATPPIDKPFSIVHGEALHNRVRKMVKTLPIEASDIQVKPETKRKHGEVPAILNLNLYEYYWNDVWSIQRAHETGQVPLIRSSHPIEKIFLLGEMVMQSVTHHEAGLHLVIASDGLIRETESILFQEILPEAVLTAWMLLKYTDNESTIFDQFAAHFHNYFETHDKHNDFEKKWVFSLFRVLSLFTTETVQTKLPVSKLLKNDLFARLKATSLRHIKWIPEQNRLGDDEGIMCHDIYDTAKAIHSLQEPGSPFALKLTAVLELAKDESDPRKLLDALRECYEVVTPRLRDPSHFPIVLGHYLLSACLLTCDGRRFMLSDDANYPDIEALKRLCTFSPKQVHCHLWPTPLPEPFLTTSKTKNVVLLTLPHCVETLDLKTLSQPIRSIQVIGNNKSHPTEWNKLIACAEQLIKQNSQLHPTSPRPFVASYLEA